MSHSPDKSPGRAELDPQTCWTLLERSAVGRLAVIAADGGPDVFPMNFLVNDVCVFVRSAPGTKLDAIAEHPLVAFEIDGTDAHHRWSVVVRGTARRLETDEDVRASGLLQLLTWTPTRKHEFIELTPRTITGRRFPRRPSAKRLSSTQQDFLPVAREGALDKPNPIPHLPPPSDQR